MKPELADDPEELDEPDDAVPLEPEPPDAAAPPVLPLDVVPLAVLACDAPGRA